MEVKLGSIGSIWRNHKHRAIRKPAETTTGRKVEKASVYRVPWFEAG